MPSKIRKALADYYDGKIKIHGPTARGADWRDAISQRLRFTQLMKLHEGDGQFSLNDLGCGYGALYAFLLKKKQRVSYSGVDFSETMIQSANRFYKGTNCRFKLGGASALDTADYTVASGIFNVRLNFGRAEWEKHVFSSISWMNRVSRKGFSFNVLSSYSDRQKMRKDLYYADPGLYFDHCKRRFSKNVALLHDYGLYEFTLLVRK